MGTRGWRRAGDPGEHFAGQQSAAVLLAKLLESPADTLGDPEETTLPRRGRGVNVRLIEAIVAVLAANGTPQARETLEALVTGTLKTGDSQAAATAALKMLLSHPCPETKTCGCAFYSAWPTAEQGSDSVRPGEVAGPAIAGINSSASEAFRVRLANYMLAGDVAGRVRSTLDCLKEPRPENLSAQIVLYQSDRWTRHGEWLEQWFSTQSSGAMSRCWAFLPVAARSGLRDDGPGGRPLSPGRGFWSPDFAAVVERRLRSSTPWTRARGRYVSQHAAQSLGAYGPAANPGKALGRRSEGVENVRHVGGRDRGARLRRAVKMLPHKDAGGTAGRLAGQASSLPR